MDDFLLIGGMLIIAIIVGAFMGMFAFAEVKQLRREVVRLRERLDEVMDGVVQPGMAMTQPVKDDPQQDDLALDIDILQQETPAPPPSVSPEAARNWQAERWARPSSLKSRATVKDTRIERFFAGLQKNWMVWLGGACVALSGIFLARYGIEQGLLGPKVRVAMGMAIAFALYAAAEVLRRKTGGSHPTFAALAGGGAITAFAAVLSAVHLYHLIEPGFAFGVLSVVALITMWLARLHGPVLAAIGMLGAYTVPILVSSNSGNVLGAMIYALIISVSVLLLLRYVYRSWLWLGMLAGALLWWLISLAGHQADGWRGLYLAALAYLVVAVIPGNWLLRNRLPESVQSAALVLPSLLVIVAAQCLSIFREGIADSGWSALGAWSPLALIVLIAARRNPTLAPVPWALFLGQLAAWFAGRLDQWGSDAVRLLPLAPEQQGAFLLTLLVTAALFSGLAVYNYLNSQREQSSRRAVAGAWWASLAVMAPLLSLLLGYALAGDYLPKFWWCLYAALFGAVFMYLGSRGVGRHWSRGMVVWLFIAAHFAYSLAVCLWLKQASLTLALALQAISLAWVIRRFEVPALGWLLKAVLVLVVVRLTLNPWLLTYDNGAHWSLWTYGGSALCAWVATKILRDSQPPLSRWAEAAALHLLVLTLWAECRYWLYGGNALAAEFSFTEAVVNMWLFTGLGLVYYRKSLLAGSFARWYDGYGRLLMLGGLANFVGILLATVLSEPWAWRAIGERPVLNMLLPAFAGPALLALMVRRYYLPGVRRFASLLAALAGFVWVSLEVRHLWQGNIRLDTAAATGELYTYSAVWLVLAVGAILLGSWRQWRSCYQGGMAVLALVIIKLFLVDMSGLEGLLRVASFMGMGLALLGIAYLHQKLGALHQAPEAEPQESGQ